MDEMRQNGESPLQNSTTISNGSPSSRSFRGRRRGDINHRTISASLRWTTNAFALLSVFLFSGIIYGWAPLKLILIREGQYDEFCGNDEGCVPQMDRFNVVFTLAQFFLSFASLPVGFFLDSSSKTVHYAIGAVAEVSGLILLGIADSKEGRDYFVVACSLIALGGCMTMLGTFPASFLLPRYQAGILAAVSCLFDASSIVFAVFYRLYVAHDDLFSRSNLLLSYGCIAIIIYAVLCCSWTLLEARNWKQVLDDEADDEVQGEVEQQGGGASANVDPHVERIRRLGMHERSLLQQLSSFDFFVVLTFASVHMLRCNFYIETVNELLAIYGDDGAVYANIFSFVLPGGIIFVPFIESTIRHLGVVSTLHFTNALGVAFGALLLVPSLPVQALNFVVFTCFRAYLYATLNTFVAVTFGVSTMGRVIGSIFTTAAIVTLLQYPAATMAESRHEGGFTVVNSIMLSACMLPIVLTLLYQGSTRKKGGRAGGEEVRPLVT